MSQLREMLDSKVDEVERLKAEGSIKDQELKKLQEAYAEEIKLHTEDVTKVDPTPGQWFLVPSGSLALSLRTERDSFTVNSFSSTKCRLHSSPACGQNIIPDSSDKP